MRSEWNESKGTFVVAKASHEIMDLRLYGTEGVESSHRTGIVRNQNAGDNVTQRRGTKKKSIIDTQASARHSLQYKYGTNQSSSSVNLSIDRYSIQHKLSTMLLFRTAAATPLHSQTTTPSLMIAWLLLLSLTTTMTTSAFQYQQDTYEHCEEEVAACTKSPTFWYQCPITCSKALALEVSIFEVKEGDPEDLYRLQVTKHDKRTILELEDFEGYVTMYAVLPLLPGMAQFYYELLEHVQGIYKYTVQTLVEPHKVVPDVVVDDSTNSNDDDDDMSILEPLPNAKTILLQPSQNNEASDLLQYMLEAGELMAGNDYGSTFHGDRVTIFLVSADGKFIERLISPTMTLLERRIAVFLKQLEWKPSSELWQTLQ